MQRFTSQIRGCARLLYQTKMWSSGRYLSSSTTRPCIANTFSGTLSACAVLQESASPVASSRFTGGRYPRLRLTSHIAPFNIIPAHTAHAHVHTTCACPSSQRKHTSTTKATASTADDGTVSLDDNDRIVRTYGVHVINWFPGHMAKTLIELRDRVKRAHVVVDVRDARVGADCLF
jgi:hypothetical protein